MSGMLPIFVGDALISLLTLLYYMQQEPQPSDEQ